LKKKIYILFMIICFLNFCQKRKDKVAYKEIDFKSISIERKILNDFWRVGKIKKVVKLEVKRNSLIGNIDHVIRNKNGDFYVGDYDSSKRILRFNQYGDFINSIGTIGQGPGEYNHIFGFALNSDGSVVLLTANKIIKFDKYGNLIKEKRINYHALDIAIIDDLIYIYILRYLYSPKIKKAILILNSDFSKIGEIYPYDTRFEKFSFLPNKIFSKSNNNLSFIDIYDFRLQIFNPKSKKIYQLQIPNENANLDVIWEKRSLTEKDKTEIKKRIHRFNFIFAYNDGLFLNEYCIGKKIYDYWILNLEKKKAIIFHYYPSSEFLAKNFFFDRIVGSYEKGVIGVFNDDERFNKYKEDFPALKDIEFTIEDNPILALFEFDKFE